MIKLNINLCCRKLDSQISLKKSSNNYPDTIHRKKIRFIINPKSGTDNKKKSEKLINRHLDRSKFNHDIIYTQSPNEATIFSQEARKLQYDIVVAASARTDVPLEIANGNQFPFVINQIVDHIIPSVVNSAK